LLSAFENIYFNNYRASLIISKFPFSGEGYEKLSEENKTELEDTLSGSVDIRFGYRTYDDDNVIIEVWLGDGVMGHYFKDTQNLLPVPFEITELLIEIFSNLGAE
jgi:hypothetical protein